MGSGVSGVPGAARRVRAGVPQWQLARPADGAGPVMHQGGAVRGQGQGGDLGGVAGGRAPGGALTKADVLLRPEIGAQQRPARQRKVHRLRRARTPGQGQGCVRQPAIE
ncbi:hypothetical protein LNKW23_23870 [Paralimibaculum aggregatum]|uniref:Uncharacterized protein n=1 Tax=Paralimibaculum aggregatum TaxID=3036245 RepID=A0ABQ6LQI7_9RHOB|nr:hypothetical protein LNKW23_23870 [Limibaculum sp. NKW23]